MDDFYDLAAEVFAAQVDAHDLIAEANAASLVLALHSIARNY